MYGHLRKVLRCLRLEAREFASQIFLGIDDVVVPDQAKAAFEEPSYTQDFDAEGTFPSDIKFVNPD
jgi:hypothetical protein